MKLRVKGHSIRLHLTRTEVASMASEGILENHTDFGSESDHFGFILTSGPKGGAVSARFTGGRIEVSVPMETLYHRVNSDEVGIYAEQQAKAKMR